MQALKGEDITLFGDGSQTRSFSYVYDLVEGYVRIMGPGGDVTGPINLRNPSEFTIRKLVEMVIELNGTLCRLVSCPLPQEDPSQPDITKAPELLGWEPTVNLRQGLENTIAYFDARPARSAA